MLTWIANCIIAACTRTLPRDPEENYDRGALDDLIDVLEDPEGAHPGIGYTYADLNAEKLRTILQPAFFMVNGRYDCGDFWYLRLLKLKYVMGDRFPLEELDRVLTSFKFWITSPGRDSVCYYSENHQCVFIVCEYLAGDLYRESVFSIDGRSGTEHRETAKERLKLWFGLRKEYGFSEFYSCNYLPINLGALGLLLTYATDAEVTEMARELITEILKLYADAAFEGTFVNASARDYPRNLVNAAKDEPNSSVVLETLFDDPENALSHRHSTVRFFAEAVLKYGKYRVPESITERYRRPVVETGVGMGLDLTEQKKEGLIGLDDRSLMMQLGAGALTNPEVIENTLRMMKKYKLYHSDFLSWIRYLTVPSLRVLGLLPWWSARRNYFQNGMALEKGNVYTYRNGHFKVSCLQTYHPGSSGAQKNTMAVTLPRGVTLFTNHPLRAEDARCSFRRSPSYFGGYGIAPCAAAHRNVVLMLYRIPKRRPAFAPCGMQTFTHAFFPAELFDEYSVNGNAAFACVGDTYVAVIGKNRLLLKTVNDRVFEALDGKLADPETPCDLIQEGRESYWIYELSSADKEDYAAFMARVRKNRASYDGQRLTYGSETEYELTYDGEFRVNGESMNTDYAWEWGKEYP